MCLVSLDGLQQITSGAYSCFKKLRCTLTQASICYWLTHHMGYRPICSQQTARLMTRTCIDSPFRKPHYYHAVHQKWKAKRTLRASKCTSLKADTYYTTGHKANAFIGSVSWAFLILLSWKQKGCQELWKGLFFRICFLLTLFFKMTSITRVHNLFSRLGLLVYLSVSLVATQGTLSCSQFADPRTKSRELRRWRYLYCYHAHGTFSGDLCVASCVCVIEGITMPASERITHNASI